MYPNSLYLTSLKEPFQLFFTNYEIIKLRNISAYSPQDLSNINEFVQSVQFVQFYPLRVDFTPRQRHAPI